MSEKIKLNTILSLVNPFKDDMFSLGKALNEKEIKDIIEKIDFKIEKDDSERLKTIKKIAYILKNNHDSIITIDIGFPEKGEESKDLILYGKHEYAAACFNKEEEIEVNVIGSEKSAKLLLGVSHVSLLEEISKPPENYLQIIDLSLASFFNEAIWSDENFCLKRLNKDFKNTYPLIDKNLLLDNKFLTKVMYLALQNKCLDMIPEEKYFNISFLKEITEDNISFINCWNKIYKDLFSNKELLKKDLKKNERLIKSNKTINKNKEITENIVDIMLNNNSVDPLSLMLKIEASNKIESLNRKVEFINELENNYLNSLEWVKGFMSSQDVSSLYHFLSPDLKNNDEILTYLIKNEIETFSKYYASISYSVYNKKHIDCKSIPLSFLKSIDNCALLINSINNLEANLSEEQVEIITKDKQYLLDLCKNILPNTKLDYLWNQKWSNEDLKHDSDIIEAFMNIFPYIYNYFNNEEKSNLKYIENFLQRTKNILYIPTVMLKEIKNEELIKEIIEDYPDILCKKTTPSSWRKNKEYILLMGKKVQDLEYTPKQWEKIAGSDLLYYEKLMLMSYELYEKFPPEIKTNESLCMNYLQNIKSSYEINYVSKVPFGSKEFCLKLLELPLKFDLQHKLIPSFFYSDKDFIIKLLEKVDESKISDKIISSIPVLHALFENFEIEEKYATFFKASMLKKELTNHEKPKDKKVKI